ncbi:MAG: DoxX family membrane protein [Terracidiphilus sp.]
MLASANFWMSAAGLVYLVAGVFAFRKEIGAARGLDKLVVFGPVFIAVSLAAFAPEHFRGPEFVQNMVPSYMPLRSLWAYFVGCALLAVATSLTVRKFERLSTTLLGLMFFLFVCMLYLPSALRHADNRFAWAYMLRDLSFCAGACALAGLHWRAAFRRLSKGLILFARIVLAIAAIDYGAQHFLHPTSAPGVPLEMMTPAWVPFASVWGYIAGLVLLLAGIGLAINWKSRMASASVGALMTALTLFLYVPVLILAYRGASTDFNDAINYVADTLLYAGSALALALASPHEGRSGIRLTS